MRRYVGLTLNRCTEDRVTSVRDLTKRCHVVQDPEGAPVCADHHVGVFHEEIVNRGRRQIELQRLPGCTGIEGHVHTLSAPA